MTLGHPLVDAALADLRLTALELNAFRVMWCQCDFEVFREKKSDVLAIELSVERSSASAALRKLVELGYLIREERPERTVGAFRLPRGLPALGAGGPMISSSTRMRRQVRSSL